MKRIMLGILLVFSLVVTAQPVLAECEPYFTGGGIIMEGSGWNSLKITFATNLIYDEEGFPDGAIIFNFLNTNSGLLDGGTFISKEISEFIIDPRELADVEDSEFLFVRVTATGEFYGEDGWTIRARFADFSGPNKKKNGALGVLRDALRISVWAPGDDPDEGDPVFYDTAWLENGDHPSEFNRDQVWRTFLDGGKVTVYCFE